MKSIEQFVNETKGKGFNMDGAYGVQCVDGWRKFCNYFDIPEYTTDTNWADGYWTFNRERYSKWFDFITDPAELKDGDWCVWARKKGSSHPSSHIGMYWKGKCYGQNQGAKVFNLKKTDFSDIIGAFRPKNIPVYDTDKPKTNEEIAREVLQGKYGNGVDRYNALISMGYDYNAIQSIVNDMIAESKHSPVKSIHTVALEVIAGLWGNGSERKSALRKAGYNYERVQREVNSILNGD